MFLQVQNAIEYLKLIGALDENENLTVLGREGCLIFTFNNLLRVDCFLNKNPHAV